MVASFLLSSDVFSLAGAVAGQEGNLSLSCWDSNLRFFSLESVRDVYACWASTVDNRG